MGCELSSPQPRPNVHARGRVKSLAQQYSDRLTYMQHIEVHPPLMKTRKENIVYYRIAEHYKCVPQPRDELLLRPPPAPPRETQACCIDAVMRRTQAWCIDALVWRKQARCNDALMWRTQAWYIDALMWRTQAPDASMH
jgi:hypothetical protein